MTIAYITAGGAGMFCGSCMSDNTLARALTELGQRVVLVPTYTPIRTDDEDVSVDAVFFGGINVYLQQKLPFLRFVPRMLDRWLDSPALIRRVARLGVETHPRELGALTVSMLRGESGRQRKEVRRLVSWLAEDVKPSLVVLTNLLIGGCAPAIRRRVGAPVVVTLQGDDVFFDQLIEPWRSRALEELRRLAAEVDGFVAHSRYYAEHMAALLDVPLERIRIVPLGIALPPSEIESAPSGDEAAGRAPTVGYLARVCPEKGFHVLIDAFIELCKRRDDVRLRAAGWLGDSNRAYFTAQLARMREAGVLDAFEYAGSIERAEKFAFLRSLDVLSVPTTYREPKGLFVLEALACGVPVVQPEHGAFPELVASTGGGRLVPPNDAPALANALEALLDDAAARRQLGAAGRDRIRAAHSAEAMARRSLEVYREFAPL